VGDGGGGGAHERDECATNTPYTLSHAVTHPHPPRPPLRLDDPMGGEHMNVMKAGFELCHRIVAVSHGYAWECQTQEGGWGLDHILREAQWKIKGIVNGIDYSVGGAKKGGWEGEGGGAPVRHSQSTPVPS
jgi:hypothetical protein